MSVVDATPASPAQAIEVNDSATTSVNGSSATNDTSSTEVSSTAGDSAAQQEAGNSQKPSHIAPKQNPWKLRAEQSTTTGRVNPSDVIAKDDSNHANGLASSGLPPVQESTATVTTAGSHRKAHRQSRSLAPSIDDSTLWPSLDKALEDRSEARKQAPSDNVDHSAAPSAPKVNGKEKWTKYTPTITYPPVASKASRGSASGAKSSRSAAPTRTGGREKSGDSSDLATENNGKSSRSSDTSRSRAPKSRSMSVSNTRSEVPSRRETQASRDADSQGTQARSQSSKRSERGSISAPSGNTPVPEETHSASVSLASGLPSEASPANVPEHRAQRSSYDSAFVSRGRGGYRNTRGNYQANYSNRYQNPAFVQPQYQGSRTYGQREQAPYVYDQFQNFVNPSIAPMMMDPMVARQMVLNQCEYYFSIENLCKDLFLRKHMDDEGFVNLPILAKFNRVRAITMDYALIRDVCFMSSIIELRAAPGSYDKIRRAEGWEQWVLAPDQRDPSTRDVPPVSEMQTYNDQNDNGEDSQDMNIGARSFVPGQNIAESHPPTTNLNENFENLGFVERLSADAHTNGATDGSATIDGQVSPTSVAPR